MADLCRRLDGLPLAIELAAARVRQLGVAVLRERLSDRLGGGLALLAASTRGGLERHRALRATFDWSHGLLAAPEQRLLRRLAVFAGGFPLALAEAVVVDEALPRATVLDALGVLVDKSLVVRDAGEPARWRLLEPTRAFALEQLAAAGEEAAWRARQAQALADLVTATEEATWGDAPTLDGAAVRRLLAPEIDNLRAALEWALAGQHWNLAVALGANGFLAYFAAGLHTELLPTLRRLLDHLDAGTPLQQAVLLWRLGNTGRLIGIAPPELLQLKQQAAVRARSLGVRRRLAAILYGLAVSHADAGDLPAARAAAAEAEELTAAGRDAPLLPLQVGIRFKLAEVTGDLDAAAATSLWARVQFEADPAHAMSLPQVDFNLCTTLFACGRIDDSAAAARHALARAGRTPPGASELLCFAAVIAAAGAPSEALALLRAHRATLEREPNQVLINGHETLAMLAAARGQVADARRLLDAQRARLGAERWPPGAITRGVRAQVLARCGLPVEGDDAALPPDAAPLDAATMLALTLRDDAPPASP
ncbi:MAG TPA: hypothetical protein PKO45_14650 [Rubrivivax sp.]|nr:hypothetical protein [Rubrivivax sp.]